MAAKFDVKGEYSCRTAWGRYDETEKFTVKSLKLNGKRDINFHTLSKYAKDVCTDYGSELIECSHDGYSIFIDLTYMRPLSKETGAIVGYEFDGTIDTFWRSRSSIICRQMVTEEQIALVP